MANGFFDIYKATENFNDCIRFYFLFAYKCCSLFKLNKNYHQINYFFNTVLPFLQKPYQKNINNYIIPFKPSANPT
jgi:hypothetical protein